jgi:hypothetical protein
MQLDPHAFNRFLAFIGQDALWRRSYTCPCRNPTSGAPDPRCLQCFGKGHTWNAPDRSTVGMASQKTQERWAVSGRFQEGDIVVTIPGDVSMYDIGQYDRVTMLNSSDRFSQPYTRGAPSERMVFQPESLERVYWLHPTTKQPVEGALPTISDEGVFTWPAVGAPPLGVTYSITGKRRSEYFCFGELPSNRNMHGGAALPRKVVLRRWDLFGR